MAMNVPSTLSYSNYQSSYKSSNVKEKKEEASTSKTAKGNVVSNGEKQLSKAAQKVLQSLRSSKSDMDFMVADYDKGDNAKDILAQSNKEFTVIFSSEELEKMALDEKYYAEKMKGIDGALRMSEEINAQFGFERAFGKAGVDTDGVTMTKFGISFNSDGTTSFFAEIEKSSNKQKEWLEKSMEKKAEEKKANAKINKTKDQDVKRVILQANSKDELIDMIKNINWDTLKDNTKTVGGNFDYSV